MNTSQSTWMLKAAIWLVASLPAIATPANKAALGRHYEKFLGAGLDRCTTCHKPSPLKDPQSLDEFPHNLFGDRLRALGEELEKAGKSRGIPTRLALVAGEDCDGDGADNETELLAGTNPGDAEQKPAAEQLAKIKQLLGEWQQFLASYRWKPFDRVARPAIPVVGNADWVRTPIDAFIADEHGRHGLVPRPMASKPVLLRRLYLDLIGLSPTPDEQRAFADDHSSDAYEKVVDRLLADPRYGERWGRHWMDIWRYSDWAGWTDGKQVRDSQRHIWRWRDWIIESLNADKGYDRMIVEMLAADELAPEDPAMLRATGFLVRNYKMLSREQWLEDTVKHTAQAFLGITLGCAKCHEHKTDPIAQADYYQVRAIFEPHQVRTDRLPGELDRVKDGLVRVYDVEKPPPTYFFNRGDEQKPDKERILSPAVPRALCGDKLDPKLQITPVNLPSVAANPDKRDFVIADSIAASEQALARAREVLVKAQADAATTSDTLEERDTEMQIADAKHAALLAVVTAEKLEDHGAKGTDEWRAAATDAATKQRGANRLELRLALRKNQLAQAEAQRRLDAAARLEEQDETATTSDAIRTRLASAEKVAKEFEAARKKAADAEQALAKAEEEPAADALTSYKPRPMDTYPASSTGRRLAFAQWIANPDNPLTARVAMNHLWLRHFGRGLVATPENLGNSGARPTHPALLDWLATELMSSGWKMKAIHRLIVTSSTYRLASTSDSADAQIDPDNLYFWRMPSRRMEAELVRDNVLAAAGSLDCTMGGPEIDNALGLTSTRRSLYLRIAAEKEVEFLKIFDGPVPGECYQRRPTVIPQQALALGNSELALAQAKVLAKKLGDESAEAPSFIDHAFRRILARAPTADESRECAAFLDAKKSDPPRAREDLVLVLFNHNDFVTIR